MRRENRYIEKDNGLEVELETCIGLCVNCKHKPTCTFTGNPGTPKLFCEEYECIDDSCSEVESYINVVNPKPGEPLAESEAAGPSANKHLGLCVNCAKRDICNFPRPAGGVWFCEEYC